MFDQRDCLIMQSKKAWNGTGVTARQIDRQKDRQIDRQIYRENIQLGIFMFDSKLETRKTDKQIDR